MVAGKNTGGRKEHKDKVISISTTSTNESRL